MIRRHFLLGSGAIGLTLNSRAAGAASDRVRVACVGVHGQGRDAHPPLQRRCRTWRSPPFATSTNPC